MVVFAVSGSPMDVKWYRPPRIGLSKHKETLKIILRIKITLTTHIFYNQKDPSFIATVEQLNYDSFKQHDALKAHPIYFLSRIPV